MITKITGTLQDVENDTLTLSVDAFEYRIRIPEFTRRQLQRQRGRQVSLHTIQYLEGNPAQGRLTPRLIGEYEGKPVLYVKGKGGKRRMVACPEELAYRMQAYAYRRGIGVDDRIFPIQRARAWQIVKEAGEKAGLRKRVRPHLLRHSDAIERLRQTGNPKALQLHLGHSSTLMTMRYLSTLTAEDALRIQQGVRFD